MDGRYWILHKSSVQLRWNSQVMTRGDCCTSMHVTSEQFDRTFKCQYCICHWPRWWLWSRGWWCHWVLQVNITCQMPWHCKRWLSVNNVMKQSKTVTYTYMCLWCVDVWCDFKQDEYIQTVSEFSNVMNTLRIRYKAWMLRAITKNKTK